MKLSNVKSSIIITHRQLQCKQISDSQAFRSAQRNNIHSENFSFIMRNWGCKAKNWGYSCTPAPT